MRFIQRAMEARSPRQAFTAETMDPSAGSLEQTDTSAAVAADYAAGNDAYPPSQTPHNASARRYQNVLTKAQELRISNGMVEQEEKMWRRYPQKPLSTSQRI